MPGECVRCRGEVVVGVYFYAVLAIRVTLVERTSRRITFQKIGQLRFDVSN